MTGGVLVVEVEEGRRKQPVKEATKSKANEPRASREVNTFTVCPLANWCGESLEL